MQHRLLKGTVTNSNLTNLTKTKTYEGVTQQIDIFAARVFKTLPGILQSGNGKGGKGLDLNDKAIPALYSILTHTRGCVKPHEYQYPRTCSLRHGTK